MSIAAATLRDLHRIHTQLADLRTRLERGPKAVALREAAVKKLEDAAAAAHETVKQHRLAADRKQLDLKTSEDRIAGWRVNLNAAASNKEYQALSEQIAAAEMAGSVLADETLELLERIDELAAQAAKADEDLAKAKAELGGFVKQISDQAETLRGEVSRLEGDLAAAEKPLTGELKTEYQRVIRNKGADGLAAVEERVCTGCGQQITLNQHSSLTLAGSVFCGSCGCLLYLPE